MCAVIALTFSILAICGVFNSDNKELSPISFAEKRVEMLLGGTKQLSLEGLEENLVATYSSSDEKIATVTEAAYNDVRNEMIKIGEIKA